MDCKEKSGGCPNPCEICEYPFSKKCNEGNFEMVASVKEWHKEWQELAKKRLEKMPDNIKIHQG
jgi:hypothetical protein